MGDPPFLVDAEPHPLGVYGSDGARLTTREIMSAGRAHRAFRRHQCPADDAGLSLFRTVE